MKKMKKSKDQKAEIKDEEIKEVSTDEQKVEESEEKEMIVEEEEIEELSDLEKAEIATAEAKDKYLRLYSEFENFRRRTAKERNQLFATAGRDLVEDLLPVLDDLDRAKQSSDDEKATLESVKEGMNLISQKLKKTLENKGLKKMEIKKGDKFDDEFHEAITQIPAEKKFVGKIVDVVEPGYFLNDTVIRFAKVVTGAKK
ncbi:MAG: nucleotide exchange factor GrpE [Cytophagales bacterium]|nr:nucleotide exchange factor GrpE [Cytophagales bacterium]